jgi:DNA-binding MarR family transcriptional regulator
MAEFSLRGLSHRLPQPVAPGHKREEDRNSNVKDQASLTSPFTALRSASRAVTHLYDLVLSPTGLKATQFITLKAIAEAGELAQCDFAREYCVAVETLSRRLGALRRKGLIAVRIGPTHGERIYSLTPQGDECLRRAGPYWEAAENRLKKTLAISDWATVLNLCDRTMLAAQAAEQARIPNAWQSRSQAAGDDAA